MRLQRKLLLLQFVVFCGLAFSGCLCQFDPYASLITTTKPAPEKVSGRYALTEQTINDQPLAAFLSGHDCTIVLQAHGTCQVANYPEWDQAGKITGYVTCSGTWKLNTAGTVTTSTGDKTAWGIRLSSASWAEDLDLTGQAPPFGLLLTVGDPDSGRVLLFQPKP